MASGITAALICKNEAQFLPGCLQSVRPVVDRMVVVDTGSTDGTPQIARQFGAKVVSFPWRDDFSAARNAALAHVRTPWVLVIDADEVLVEADRGPLLQAVQRPVAHAYNLRIVSLADQAEHLSEALVTRLFRADMGIRWTGAVHEQVIPSILARRLQLGALGVRLLHYGYLGQVMKARDKVQRNLRLLEAAVARTPQDPYAWWQLSQSYLQAGRPADALEAIARARVVNAPEPGQIVLPGLIPLMALTEAKAQWLSGGLEQAEATLSDGIAQFPDYTDFWYYRGLVRSARENWAGAYADWLRAAELGEPRGYLQTETGISLFKAPWRLAFVSFKLGRPQEAEAWLLLTIKRQPYFQTAWRDLLRFLEGTPVEQIGRHVSLTLTPAEIAQALGAFPKRTLAEELLRAWALTRAEGGVA